MAPGAPRGVSAGAAVRTRLIPTLAAAAVVALTVSLGNWQLRRADEKDALQQGRDAALALAPVALTGTVSDAAALDGRRVAVEGVFDAARTVLLDNRTRNGVAGFHVLAPVRLAQPADAAPRHVLVLRGWIARDLADRTRLPALRTPEGPVRIEGLALAALPQPIVLGDTSGGTDDSRIWQRFGFEAYGRWSGLSVLPVLVRQTSELDDGLARDWVQPGGGVDRHRGYAFQWYALAVATLAAWLWYAVLRRVRRSPGS
jgi:surfeit locus 1 family protein